MVRTDGGKAFWGAPAGDQAISIATTKRTFAPGEPIVLTERLRNVSKKPLVLEKIDGHVLYELTVLAPEVGRTHYTLYGEKRLGHPIGGSTAQIVLKPEEVHRSRDDLGRLYDFSLSGTYRVRARRYVSTDKKNGRRIYAVSNDLLITVDEAPAHDY
jgi:hypothetical protein